MLILEILCLTFSAAVTCRCSTLSLVFSCVCGVRPLECPLLSTCGNSSQAHCWGHCTARVSACSPMTTSTLRGVELEECASVSFCLFRPTSLTPVAPLASPALPTGTAVSNNSAPSLYHSLRSMPQCCTGFLRRRRTKPRIANQVENLARVSRHLTMEERLNFCMDVAKNLLDSVSAGTVPRPSVQSASVSLPSLPLLLQRVPVNTSCIPCFSRKPRRPTAQTGERPQQRHKYLFPLHLRVGRAMSQLASPANPGARAPTLRCDS